MPITITEQMPSVLSLIPSRGGSKAIHHKNMSLCGGHPLIHWTITASIQSSYISRTLVSTDCPFTQDYALSLGAESPFLRPKELSTDNASSVDVVLHALDWLLANEGFIPDYVVLLQPTSPLRTSLDIDNTLELCFADRLANSLVSVIECPHNFSPGSLMALSGCYLNALQPQSPMRRQDKETYYARNGAAIYVVKTQCFIRAKSFLIPSIIMYNMPINRSIDVDTPYDLHLANLLMAHPFNL